jgi:predicted ribosome quality control (RQC) complex YloA/Tae2 family protein
MLELDVDGYTIRVGRNARENWEMFDRANECDLLFHLSSFPSPYVIVETNNELVVKSIIEKCANLCKQYSKYSKWKRIKVDYSRVDNIRKGEKVGEIFYLSNKKISQIFS